MRRQGANGTGVWMRWVLLGAVIGWAGLSGQENGEEASAMEAEAGSGSGEEVLREEEEIEDTGRRQEIMSEINRLVDQLSSPEGEDEPEGEEEAEEEPTGEEEVEEAGKVESEEETGEETGESGEAEGAMEEGTGETEDEAIPGERRWTGVDPLEKAAFFHQQGDYQLAERTYVSVLESDATRAETIRALTELAEVYRDRGTLARAVDTLETCLRKYPEIAERPNLLFRLGEFYREMQLYDESISMFYRVLNAIVVTGEENLEKYLRLARLAQFEIARAHYVRGEFGRAYLLFDRIDLLELTDTDRETVLYYKALTALKAGKNKEGLQLVRRFVEAYPRSQSLPEMLYLEAEVLYRLDRIHAAVDTLMRLLETVGEPVEDQSKEWTFWRQQAGNRLANKLYEDGDYLVALRIYQGMVGLSDQVDWRLPIIYQIGLCFEKLGMLDRARESFAYLIQEVEKREAEAVPDYLVRLAETASWRQDLLSWRGEISADLRELVYEGEGEPGNREEEETE